jgi:transcriptional regulator
MPDNYRRSMLASIVAFRLPIDHIEGKWKLSQNRAPEERARIRAAQAAGSEDERALAAWMQRLGL